ncbi:hypothetical protein L0N33_23190, partial [Roseburia faecis]|nr:hypothetical protein [Roseburia faecis]
FGISSSTAGLAGSARLDQVKQSDCRMMVRFKDDKAPCSGKWPQQRAFYLSVAVVSILGKPEPLQHDL